jgi:hypothetical protein
VNSLSIVRPLRGPVVAALMVALAACGGQDADQPVIATNASLAAQPPVNPYAKFPDHHEFDVSLNAPYVSSVPSGARNFSIRFDYPGATATQTFAWSLELLDSEQKAVHRWVGETAFVGRPIAVDVPWAGRTGALSGLADGRYAVRLQAVAIESDIARGELATGAQRIDRLLASERSHGHASQSWDIWVGKPARAAMPAHVPLRVASATADGDGRARAQAMPATGALPYTIYLANLHSQTNDSDGGGDLSNCTSSQPAQSGAFGPAAAFAYAKAAGLDALMTSEHNHYFDGSSSTNAAASAAGAKARYQAGLTAAANFNAANPNFLAIYGMEWGVISNGGHLNILGSKELFSWEYNSTNELLGDRLTAKSDYAALYTTMRAQGLIGQFNHPDTTGQFLVNGTPLGYTADGDEVMVLSEILNTSAFSSNSTESETGRSTFERAFNLLLERGFHVAPSTNQDNHCANWGKAYTNRTGVLIPNGTALTSASFTAALKARRVFATMDKTAQIVLTANGRLMGERFVNSGPLALNVGYASSSGRSAATVQIFEGVPGRNGTVTALASTGAVSITPTTGAHFYYAKVTQDDGKILWSAPVWVTQSDAPAPDTVAPTATASVSGTSGTITLSATASDNVGVTKVDFLVDNALVSTDSTAPYAAALDSKTLTNGNHTLVARAFDAAGNSGSSAVVSFAVSNAGAVLNETESNGNIAAANAVSGQTTISGTMGNTTDKDYFRLSLPAGKTLKVGMVGPATTDYDLYLVDSTDKNLAVSESSTSTENVLYKNPSTTAARTVYIKVQSYKGSSTTQRYTLSLVIQ